MYFFNFCIICIIYVCIIYISTIYYPYMYTIKKFLYNHQIANACSSIYYLLAIQALYTEAQLDIDTAIHT